ncbi:hypothetical protein LguiA_025696 [Lonicera macranthoides]
MSANQFSKVLKAADQSAKILYQSVHQFSSLLKAVDREDLSVIDSVVLLRNFEV